jgi:hypothetical protein
MAEQTTKRATQKALDAFCTSNNLTPECIWDKLSSLYPNKYIQSEELIKKLIKGLFKAYNEVDDATIITYLKELDETRKLYSYTVEAEVSMEWHNKLSSILEKVKEDVMKGDVRLSSYPEYSSRLIDFIQKKYTWDSCYTEEGKYALGKAFYNFFTFWHYDYAYLPFRCYATKDGKDVLFTKDSHQWIESKGCYDFETSSTNTGCMRMIVLFFITGLLVACSLFQ